jgi:hypothetical protein
LNSVEADSRLVCKSSKLTEGRNSKEVAVSATSSGTPFLPPKEKREWLFEDEALSIGASRVGRRMEPILVGLPVSDLLNRKTKARLADSSQEQTSSDIQYRRAGCNKRGTGQLSDNLVGDWFSRLGPAGTWRSPLFIGRGGAQREAMVVRRQRAVSKKKAGLEWVV